MKGMLVGNMHQPVPEPCSIPASDKSEPGKLSVACSALG